MFDLYKHLEDNRNRIISLALSRVPREVPAYFRVPRGELRQSMEHLFDAYLDLLASGNDTHLRQIFGYVARVRVAQSFRLSAVLRALLCFNEIIRPILQDRCRMQEGGKQLYEQYIMQIERTSFNAIGTFSDVFQDYVQSCVDEHNQYLSQKTKQLGVDLSKFVLFRA